MNVLQFVPHRFLSEMVKDALHALYIGFSMAVADDFETIFDKLPVVANQDVNEGSQAVKDTYPIIRKAYSSVAEVMGSAPSIQECGFKDLDLSIVKASNGPIDFNHQVANPRHTPVPYITVFYKKVFESTTQHVYPVLLFDHQDDNSANINRVWFGLGMGVDNPGDEVDPAKKHQQVLTNFSNYVTKKQQLNGWEFGVPPERGHRKLNKYLDSFICWKCYSGGFPTDKEFVEDVDSLFSSYLEFLKTGAVDLISSFTTVPVESKVMQTNPWSWGDKSTWFQQSISLLFLEAWRKKTLGGDLEYDGGPGYTNRSKNPSYIVRAPDSILQPGQWKIKVNNKGGQGRDNWIYFKDIIQIGMECAQSGSYKSENSGDKDRTGIKALVALLPEFFEYESANTIRFLGASGSTPPPPVSSKSVDELTEEEKRLVDLLSVTNNVILDGVPGTGKTYIAKRISKLVAENTRGHCTGKFAITLHPSTSYEDFVEGLRPNQNRVETRNVNPIRVLIDHPSDDKLRMLVTLDASGATSWSPCTLEEVENGTPLISKPVPTLEEKTDSKPAPSLLEFTKLSIDDAASNPVDSSSKPPAEQMFFFETPAQNPDAQFSIEDGFFLRVCKEALQYPEEEVYILIDEINRGNVPKVLGDLLSTMEDSKRIPSTKAEYQGEVIDVWRLDQDNLTITLPYSKRVFFVPENIKIIATRNTTDRSVVPLDAALRRRFSFFRLEPNRPDGMENLKTYLDVIFDKSTGLNAHLEENIGPDAMIGHSYFYDMETSSAPELIWKYSVLTQLVDVLDAANYLDKANIEQINEILQPSQFFLQSIGENLHQKLRVRKLSEED